MNDDLVERMAPLALWELVKPRLPEWTERRQGGGTAPRDERASLAAVAYVLVTGCAWSKLPPVFGVSHATAHRRFANWSASGLWASLHAAVPSGAITESADQRWVQAVATAAMNRSNRTQ